MADAACFLNKYSVHSLRKSRPTSITCGIDAVQDEPTDIVTARPCAEARRPSNTDPELEAEEEPAETSSRSILIPPKKQRSYPLMTV